MKRFVDTNLILYVSLLLFWMIGSYIFVEYSIENQTIFETLFHLSIAAFYTASFYLNKDLFDKGKNIFLRFTIITLVYIIMTLVLWFISFTVLGMFQLLMFGSH